MRWLLISLIKFYSRFISPIFHAIIGPMGGCRFTPGCAQYAIESIEEWGVFRGSWLAIKRVSRCHPWNKGGFDPVPLRDRSGHITKSEI